jgi:hypothetical protein
MKEAYVNSLDKVKDKKQIMEGKTITKSISAAKRKKSNNILEVEIKVIVQ